MINLDLDTVAFLFAAVDLLGIALLSVLMFSQALEIRSLKKDMYRRAIEEEHAEDQEVLPPINENPEV